MDKFTSLYDRSTGSVRNPRPEPVLTYTPASEYTFTRLPGGASLAGRKRSAASADAATEARRERRRQRRQARKQRQAAAQ